MYKNNSYNYREELNQCIKIKNSGDKKKKKYIYLYVHTISLRQTM